MDNDLLLKIGESVENSSKITRALIEEIKSGEYSLAALKADVAFLKDAVRQLSKIVRDGNGNSLLTKVALIAQRIELIDKFIIEQEDRNLRGETKVLDLAADVVDVERRLRTLEGLVRGMREAEDARSYRETADLRNSVVEAQEFAALEAKNRAEIKKEKTALLLKVIGVVIAAIIGGVFAILGLK